MRHLSALVREEDPNKGKIEEGEEGIHTGRSGGAKERVRLPFLLQTKFTFLAIEAVGLCEGLGLEGREGGGWVEGLEEEGEEDNW